MDGGRRAGVRRHCVSALFGRAVHGVFLNGEAISVSRTSCLRENLISVGTNPGHRENADKAFAIARRVYKQCCDIRRLCYVASGRLDGFVEHGLKAWDYAAGALVLREAGGRMTDFSGKAPACGRWSSIVATNGKIHGNLMTLI